MKRSDVHDLRVAFAREGIDADAEAVAEHLEDLGVVGFHHRRVRSEEPELPLASTSALPKRRTS